MAVNPSQSWITPTTSLFGAGGGVAASLLVADAQPGFSTISDQITGGFDAYNANNIVAVYQSQTGNLAGLQIGEYLEVQEGGNGVSSALWRTQYQSDGIVFKAQGSGTGFPYVAINRAVASGESFTGVALTNISTLNTHSPSVFSTKDTPGPPSGATTTIGSLSYDGTPTLVEIDPTLYKQKMRVFLTPTTNDGTPDGLYTYSNEAGASLSSFTVSGGSNANVEISYMTIGW